MRKSVHGTWDFETGLFNYSEENDISAIYIYNFFLLNNLYSIHIYFILNVWECGHERVFPPWCACGWVCTWMWGMNFVVTTIINPCWCKKSGYGHKIYITFFFFSVSTSIKILMFHYAYHVGLVPWISSPYWQPCP